MRRGPFLFADQCDFIRIILFTNSIKSNGLEAMRPRELPLLKRLAESMRHVRFVPQADIRCLSSGLLALAAQSQLPSGPNPPRTWAFGRQEWQLGVWEPTKEPGVSRRKPP
jgi:hypothetical protein